MGKSQANLFVCIKRVNPPEFICGFPECVNAYSDGRCKLSTEEPKTCESRKERLKKEPDGPAEFYGAWLAIVNKHHGDPYCPKGGIHERKGKW